MIVKNVVLEKKKSDVNWRTLKISNSSKASISQNAKTKHVESYFCAVFDAWNDQNAR